MTIKPEINDSELDELKLLRAKKFIAEHPTNQYSAQFDNRKFSKMQLRTIEQALRRQAKARLNEDKITESYSKTREKHLKRQELNELRLEEIRRAKDERRLRKESLINKREEELRLAKEAKFKLIKEELIEMFELKKTMTLEKIGAIYGVTRERIRQKLNRGTALGLFVYEKRPVGPYEITCKCGKVFLSSVQRRIYCSKECPSLRVSPEEQRRRVRNRIKFRYNNDPIYREKVKIAQKKYYLKIKTDASYIEKQKVYSKRWLEKKKEGGIPPDLKEII